jgi:hypothetical protein
MNPGWAETCIVPELNVWFPVKVFPPDRFDLRFRAVWVADDTGLFASDVLSIFPKPTIDLVIPETVPVKVGSARFALSSSKLSISVGVYVSTQIGRAHV